MSTVPDKPIIESRSSIQDTFSREMFDCLQVLDGTGLHCWLDYGTLLGACRDQCFIEWDSDVDLGIFPHEVDKIVNLRREFKEAGFEMEVISYRKKVHQVHVYRRRPSVNFNVYHRGDECFWSLWLISANRFSQLNMQVLHQKSFVSRVYRAAVKKVRALVPKHVISWLFRDKIIVSEVPRSFFEQQGEMEFMGRTFPVPGERETYLELRYGKDWREPRRDWVYWRDDGAIVS